MSIITTPKKISFIDAQHKLWDFLVDNHKTTTLTDQEFATSESIKTAVFDFIGECKSRKIKTTFNNFTNMNLHFLVHILVLNNLMFFMKCKALLGISVRNVLFNLPLSYYLRPLSFILCHLKTLN